MSKSSIGAWRSVSPAVHLCVLQPHGANVGSAAGGQRAALVDCGSTPGRDAALLERARDFAGMPVSHVMVTRLHHDHRFGLAGTPGTTFITHEDLLCNPKAEVLDAAAAIGLSRLLAPDETLPLMRSLDLEGVRLGTLHLDPAHTRADIVVVIPGEDTIFMGDLVESAGDPQLGPASDTSNWPKIFDDALGASTEATRFVPGHVPTGREESTVDRGFCFRQQVEIIMVQGTIRGLVYQSMTLENAFGSAEWPFDESTMRVALPLAYRRLVEKGVEPKQHLPLV